MTEQAPVVISSDGAVGLHREDTARWPLAYSLQPLNPAYSGRVTPKRWWSHRLYRGPGNKEVQILYSRTKAQSEDIAQHFLNETVIGFDMEWPWNDWKRDDLQNKIGLIQIATQDKIALFHIGLHPGKTVDDIIAPSLKKLIQDPNIGKLGVGVLSADFSRLRRFFGLQPKGAVELSHLYRLIKYGAHKPEYVSTKMVSLANQVEDQLGYPLYKGDVRTSNWSKPLSQDQINYAAGDAYAGLMLYHCMNAKRLKMTPAPPLPIHADIYQPFKFSKITPLRLQALEADGSFITSDAFFKVPMKEEDIARLQMRKGRSTVVVTAVGSTVVRKKAETPKPKTPAQPLDAISQGLYDELVIRRSALVETTKLPIHRIAVNAVLEGLARKRPLDKSALLNVKGIGKLHQERYGHVWIEVISQYLSANGLPTTSNSTSLDVSASKTSTRAPSTPTRRRRDARQDTNQDSSPAFASPTLHTGLSFNMGATTLSTKRVSINDADADADPDSDSSLPSLKFNTPPRRISGAKRRRTTSPAPSRTPQAPSQPSKLPPRPASTPPLISDHTLRTIVTTRPASEEELLRIPGVGGLAEACGVVGVGFWRNVGRFIGVVA
ncbi:ribonuclease H-like protein [Dothidotthia symphoricarpi CBS 119687]|uniref:Ribonuclease H-like protein n=1 Tax=Dothidotthia symphoricarpi CBS 119687 TaxID=1392245 RepID=A0A6A6A0I8_9PLEO|nr:ribonuclease H-like protein [Dothidotthia symphoricarpi CBS 119687]KAF2125512.1 ribonuclease H-like protein [Dothidotthia symphoricarpi CBS 119687]